MFSFIDPYTELFYKKLIEKLICIFLLNWENFKVGKYQKIYKYQVFPEMDLQKLGAKMILCKVFERIERDEKASKILLVFK